MYIDQANLATDATFIKRITLAIAHFANYIVGEAPSAANHQQRFRWAINAILNPGSIAQAIAPAVCLDPNVISQLGAIDDPTLQTAVETVCNNLLFT